LWTDTSSEPVVMFSEDVVESVSSSKFHADPGNTRNYILFNLLYNK